MPIPTLANLQTLTITVAVFYLRFGSMHPPLSRPHPSCQDVIVALKLCHEENSFQKFFGVCNVQKKALDVCFLQEKKDKRAANAAKARASRARFEQRMAEKR